MAASTKQVRRSATPKTGSGPPVPLGFIVDLTVLVAAAVAAGLTLVLAPNAVEWLYETLALGWVPVAAWTLGTVVMLRYWPKVLFRGWNWWLVSAGLTAIAIGTLSFFHPGYGIYSEVSLGGAWGTVLGGSPLWLGVAKLLAIAVVLPLLAYPRLVGAGYLKGGRWTGARAGSGGKKAGKGAYNGLKASGRGMGRAVPVVCPPPSLPQGWREVRRACFRAWRRASGSGPSGRPIRRHGLGPRPKSGRVAGGEQRRTRRGFR